MLATTCSVPSIAASIIDLGTLGGNESWASGINNAGQVVGNASAYGHVHPFLYSGGQMTDLDPLNPYDGSAFAINNAGQIVGSQENSTGVDHAVFYTAGHVTDILPPSDRSIALAINNAGQVVGYTNRAPFLYSAGQLTYPFANFGNATGINDSGQVVGEANSHAALYQSGHYIDLAPLGGVSQALAINNAGQVVGYNSSGAFLYSDGKMTNIGTVGSTLGAEAINNAGQVVGSYTLIAGIYHAFLYSAGALIDLDSFLPANSDWLYLDDAAGINDHGQIVGEGEVVGTFADCRGELCSQQHAFLLDITPEPTTLGLIGFGVVLLGLARKRLKQG
jgi:probable HAF family extracellular repeat protein